MRGAVESVDPVTATLPVVPFRLHSGAPVSGGATAGHALSPAGVSSGTGGVNASETGDDDVLAEGLSVSEPHAESVMANDAAQAATAREDRRDAFTAVTLLPGCFRAIGAGCFQTLISLRCCAQLPAQSRGGSL